MASQKKRNKGQLKDNPSEKLKTSSNDNLSKEDNVSNLKADIKGKSSMTGNLTARVRSAAKEDASSSFMDYVTRDNYKTLLSYFSNSLTKDELNDYDKERLKNLIQDREERKKFGDLYFSLISIWLLVIAILLIAVGAGNLHLSDSILITLLGTTTINLLGGLYIIMRYLFNQKIDHWKENNDK